MRGLWQKLNHQLNHQVYLRVFPVVAICTLVVGSVGWLALTRSATHSRISNGQNQLEDTFRSIENELATETLILELQRVKRTGDNDSGPIPAAGAAARIKLTRGKNSKLESISWDDRTNRRPESASLAAWAESNQAYLKPDYRPGSWDGVRIKSTPRPLIKPPGVSAMVFDVMAVDGAFYFPVVVQSEAPAVEHHQLYLFPVDRLLAEHGCSSWWCALDADGLVIQDQGGNAQPGLSLSDQPDLSGHPILSSKRGQGLVQKTSDPEENTTRIGKGWIPWIAMRSETQQLGLTLIMVDQAEDYEATVLVFMVIFLAATLLALFGVMFGINRVMTHTSAQLRALARNMENLARGDYSGRMPRIRDDEVGTLVGYFNLMAVSLDEAHRQVKEKSSHLQAALENMRLLDRAKDDFLVLISHEVRTPLTAIMGGVDFLKSSMEKISEEEREVLNRLNVEEIAGIIRSSGQRLSGFMTDAIQMTSLGSADARLNLKAQPVGEVVSRGLCGVAELAASNEIAIHNQLEAPSPWSILCDVEVLTVAFEKVLKNAITHNHTGGVVIIREAVSVPGNGTIAELIDKELLRRLEAQQTFIDHADDDLRWRLVEIFNTGQPIPADRRAALFGKFELVGPIENHQKGSGLSLPIARAAVESHGGRLMLGSENEEGNSFFILLPTLANQPAEQVDVEPTSIQQQPHGVSGTAWDENISEVGDSAGLKVEFEDLCASILGDFDETGGGVDSPGRTHDKEKVTVVRSLK